MEARYVDLHPTEAAVAQLAATIYAGYIAAGQVTAGQEEAMMDRSVEEAIYMAKRTDQRVQNKKEMG